MLVEAQVSSMNTSRAGSRSSCSSNQASRRFSTSGLSCSAACAVFFLRAVVPIEEAPQSAMADRHATLCQCRPQFRERDVGCRLVERQDQLAVALDAMRAPVTAHRFSARVALLAFACPPAAHARRTHPEALGYLPMAQTCGRRGDDANPKIKRER